MLEQATLKYATKGASNIPYSNDALNRDLVRINKLFSDFQSSRARDSIYPYLTAVYELVEWWTADRREIIRAQLALRTLGIAIPDEVEPFASIIVATAYPNRLDKRVVSKWSRVLRYVAMCGKRAKSLRRFVSRKGGINACATLYASTRATNREGH